jgi:hypothetical protein
MLENGTLKAQQHTEHSHQDISNRSTLPLDTMLASIALATAAIAVSVVLATPVANTPRIITIPLHKRGSPLSKDGKAIASALARQFVNVQV